MRNLYYYLFFVFHFFSISNCFVNAQPKLVFDTETFNFGTIPKGSSGIARFNFKNIGNEALVIQYVYSSSGGLVSSWPKEPIAPGACGSIIGHYDTKRVGAFEKTLTMSSNMLITNKVLKIKGIVYNSDSILLTSLSCDENKVDVGTLNYGQSIDVFFKIENVGENGLVIERLWDHNTLDYFISSIGCYYEQFEFIGMPTKEFAVASNTPDLFYQYFVGKNKSLWLKVHVRNMSGKAGKVTKELKFKVNTPDSIITLMINSEFTDDSEKQTHIINSDNGFSSILEFQNGILQSFKKFRSDTILISEGMINQEFIISKMYSTYNGIEEIWERTYNKNNFKKVRERKFRNNHLSDLEEIEAGLTVGSSWYDNGNLRSKRSYKGNNLFGECLDYYENGLLKQIMFFKMNRLDGQFTQWYENGNLAMQGSYDTKVNAQPLNTSNTGEYSQSGKVNTWNYWDETGKLVKKEFYKKGKLIKTKTYK